MRRTRSEHGTLNDVAMPAGEGQRAPEPCGSVQRLDNIIDRMRQFLAQEYDRHEVNNQQHDPWEETRFRTSLIARWLRRLGSRIH
jgi:hypothetical protein